ncbi:hypothetical protein [Flexithrix dorotheae]|uniref:hypothetical protein n=1 Tax=Flexithrix dorotheae TaxID=70993 RepID=UPI000381AADF|nr:hypothetical protein [Flexithrix dorotheae]
MKTNLLLCLFLFVFGILTTFGQDLSQLKQTFEKPSLGISINQFQRDFGVGLIYTSKYFGNKSKKAIKASYNFQYLEHVNDNAQTVWTNYSNAKLGLVLATNPIHNFFRYYGELGGILILPNSQFSDESVIPGAYGLFGFEFLFLNEDRLSKSIFIELGAMGTGATAEKVLNEPIYSNGFSISVGFRLFPKNSKNE